MHSSPVETFAFFLLLILGGIFLLGLALRAWRRRGTLPGEIQRLPGGGHTPIGCSWIKPDLSNVKMPQGSGAQRTPIEPPPPRRGGVSLVLLVALCVPQASCTARQAKIGALDFAACAGADVVLPSVAGLARQLVARTDWQTWGLTQLGGALGPATACGLHALATALRADAPRPAVDDLAVLRRLAARCGPAGTCQGAEERAAWILWRASGRPFPSSGEG